MSITPPTVPPSPLSYTVQDVLTDALIEIGALAPGESSANHQDEFQWAFRKLNYLCDTWQAMKSAVWSYAFSIYTLVPNLSPHTIGPSGLATFLTSGPRPVRLESAAQLINSPGNLVDLPINLRDHDWWAAQQVKEITTNVVTDVFYDPTSPDGSLFFWPVPNQQNQVRLQFWQTVSQFVTINDPIGGPGGPGTLPQGIRAALMLTLAETLLPGENRELHPVLAQAALRARKAAFGNNDKSPRIATQDSGMPKAGKIGVRGDFNWVTGGAPGGAPE